MYNRNLNILQATNLIACGFGIGVVYGENYYIMNKNHKFNYKASKITQMERTEYSAQAFGDINTLKLITEIP